MSAHMPGPGDPITWPPCDDHPHDPRTPDVADSEEMSDEAAAALEVCQEIRLWLELAERGLQRGDLLQFRASMESAQRYLSSMDFRGVSS